MKEKIIELNSNKDIEKFNKKIWIYKSIFYYNVKFVLKNSTEEKGYEELINVLNIKNRKKRITYIYDKACELIEENNRINKVDCEFKNNQCMAHRNTKYYNGCCRLCMYQSEKGCKTQNLTCKLFFCSDVCKKYKVLKYEDLKLLKCLSIRNRLIVRDDFFASRKSFLFDLYLGSIVIYAVKVLYRIIVNVVYFGIIKKGKKDEI